MQETYSVLGNVTTLGSSILSSLSSYMSGGSTLTSAVVSSASTWMSQLTSLANTQFGGSYLFSGSSSDTAPVNTTGYTPTVGTPDTSYYQGSTTGTNYTGSDGYTVPTSVQANSSGFEQLFRALSTISTAATASTSTTVDATLRSALSSAYSLIQSGNSQLAETQATVSSNTAALTAYQSAASDKVTTLQSLATSLTGSDIASATVQVTTLQTQLESSYETVTKLMSDSLAKYIS
jgi:flagellar hook-associated protein 3 FlgL